jgi:hypothetical protein
MSRKLRKIPSPTMMDYAQPVVYLDLGLMWIVVTTIATMEIIQIKNCLTAKESVLLMGTQSK